MSQYFGVPSPWQVGLIANETGRMVPDVAFAASPNNDGYLACSQSDTTATYGTDCASGFWSSTGYIGENVYGGTSASTQAFGGLLTLMVQRQGTGYGFGNLNPILYGFPTTNPSVFNQYTYLGDATPAITLCPAFTVAAKRSGPGCVTSGTSGTMTRPRLATT